MCYNALCVVCYVVLIVHWVVRDERNPLTKDRLVCRSCVWRGCGQSPGTLGCGATTKPIAKMWSDILLAYSRHQVRFGTLQDRELKLCDPFGKVCGNWDWHKKWICVVHVACSNEAVSMFRTCLGILSCAFQRIVLTVLFLWWSFWVHRSMPLWKQRSVLLSSHHMYKYESWSLLTVLTQTKDNRFQFVALIVLVIIIHMYGPCTSSEKITGGHRCQNTLTFSLHKDNVTSQTDTTLF